ncbi:uncharacterized protein LOC108678720 isoform X1 [Hyalella azteca]|uniref:Uncharacterized protein LOC108678720 isoform X1 n=1 Tax=Hyalella azteca TaxID=294128 RepID=A0A8B7P938_HYAAZ|nr:uncharacterized protein LOC108678720 isoform X1 [Hyalella azteca]
MKWLLLTAFTLVMFLPSGETACYFPVEYQGVFETQSATTDAKLHKYSSITILPDAIPGWGVCKSRHGLSVVLHDRTTGRDCFRCFHVLLRSPNVIQVYTEPSSQCYQNEVSARASCPSELDISTQRVNEIMLYKNKTFTFEGTIERVFCPINGAYDFTYDVNDGLETVNECPQSTSALQNCPRGSELSLNFQRCTFSDVQMSLRCLGDWPGRDGARYLALLDTSPQSPDQPRYRCAMYIEDETTGVINLSFSVDATCNNQLKSPYQGYETMVLTPRAVVQPPNEVKSHACVFPDWARGKWQNLEILRHDVRLKDKTSDRVFQMECLSQHAPHGERYAVFARDQCGREEFTCIWIKKRAVNVIEFQMSNYPSDHYNQSQVCADAMFVGQHWSTEGRVGEHEVPSCPIQGEHSGVLPDATDLCAKLVSDCSSPQRMHYTVASCSNSSEVYEESSKMSAFYASKPRLRREVYRIRDIGKLLRRHHSHQPTTVSSGPRNSDTSSQSQNGDPALLFDSIHTLTARDLLQNSTVFISAGDLSRAARLPDHSLLALKLQDDTVEIPTTASQKESLGTSYRQLVHGPGFAYLGGFQVNLTDTTTARPTTETESFVYPGGFVRLTEVSSTTRRPLPHESPFYRVIPSINQRESEQIREVFDGLMEDREYRCLGRWSEGGVTYTYTHRIDVDTYECFAGVVVNTKEIFIIEAGTSCLRGLQPLAHGMKLVQRATCSDLRERAAATSTTTTSPATATASPNAPDNREAEMHPWWRDAARNPWQKNPRITTGRPYAVDQRPHLSSGQSFVLHWWLWLPTLMILAFSTS